MNRIAPLAFFLALAAPALAAHTPGHAPVAPGFSEGEVRKVDADAQKLTIRHGPIPSLDMPPMTMVFRVKEATMLENLKAGTKIRFHAEKIGGAYTVTQMEEAK